MKDNNTILLCIGGFQYSINRVDCHLHHMHPGEAVQPSDLSLFQNLPTNTVRPCLSTIPSGVWHIARTMAQNCISTSL
jgi:hypothetical protein